MSTPQHALTVPAALAPRDGHRTSFGVLARLESARLARHPLFIAGAALGVFFTGSAVNELKGSPTSDMLGLPVVAMGVGVFAMIAALHLARSFHGADELLDAAPTSAVARTGALCISAIVPAAVASVWLVFYYAGDTRIWTVPEWMYGTFSRADVAAILIGNTVVAAAGGTLLGVAAGRWWRFRGASAALVVAMVIWSIGVIGMFSNTDTIPAEWHRWVRLLTPINYFATSQTGSRSSDSLTGSPWWYLAWLVTLCALATIAALLWRSEGPTRRRLVRLGAIVLAISALTYVLAAGGGNSQVVRTYPDGHSIVLTP